jgi:hypothetical protein
MHLIIKLNLVILQLSLLKSIKKGELRQHLRHTTQFGASNNKYGYKLNNRLFEFSFFQICGF